MTDDFATMGISAKEPPEPTIEPESEESNDPGYEGKGLPEETEELLKELEAEDAPPDKPPAEPLITKTLAPHPPSGYSDA